MNTLSSFSAVYAACEPFIEGPGKRGESSRFSAVGSEADLARIASDFGPLVKAYAATTHRLPMPGEFPQGLALAERRKFTAAAAASLSGAYLNGGKGSVPVAVDPATQLHPGADLWSDPNFRVIPMVWSGRSESNAAALVVIVVRRAAVRAGKSFARTSDSR